MKFCIILIVLQKEIWCLGLGLWLLAHWKLWLQLSWKCIKLEERVHTCDPCTRKVEAENQEFEVIFGYTKKERREGGKKKREEERKSVGFRAVVQLWFHSCLQCFGVTPRQHRCLRLKGGSADSAWHSHTGYNVKGWSTRECTGADTSI